MGRIRVLDDVLVNRIAAGEVVERPSSVVKELVENSLDAEAGSITVELEAGGKRRIRVSDDGSGMDRDDAILALERHATSKVRRSDDLTAIASLGFRGEALPSIAAVSRLRLRTAREDGLGTEVEVIAGRVSAVRELGLPRGTSVEVDRLFHNVPARRKFLRADNTELSHVIRLMTRFALARPSTRFRLSHGPRVLVDATKTSDPGERLRQLLGGTANQRLIPFSAQVPGLRVHGWAGRPVDAAPRRDAQHMFVNGRIVQDRVLRHAISAAYGNTVPKGYHAALVLFVDVDPDGVDVNVHPQKTEVRFRRQRDVHDAVRDAIHASFGDASALPDLGELRPAHVNPGQRAPADPVRRHLVVRDHGSVAAGWASERLGQLDDRAKAPVAHTSDPTSEPARDLLDTGAEPIPSSAAAEALAQVRASYIVARDHDGVVVVDQHAAHERVLFERFLRDAENNRVEVQRLAFPVVVELAPHELPIFDEEAEEFRRLGFVAVPFGGATVRLDAVPAVFARVDPEALFRELLGEAASARSATAASAPLRHRMITTAACKAAIKIRRPMTRSEMQRLLDDLATVDNPTTCPHGRPAIFRLSLRDIERAFRRS